MTDCFIKLDQIAGESGDADKDLAGAIQVTQWSWGADWSGELRGQGGKGSPGDIRHFCFGHSIDNATSGLFARCLNGQVIAKAVLTMRRAGGSSAQGFLKVQFEKVRIVSVDLDHDGGNELPKSRVVFAYKEVNFRYTPQSSAGADKTGAASFSFVVDT